MSHDEVTIDTYLTTSQAFVRALKASSDPPAPGGPSKLEIARSCWERKEFPVPNKVEAIADWLISKLLKERTQPSAKNPITNPEYWKLFSLLVSEKAPSTDKNWLHLVATRFPLQHLVVTYLTLSPQMDKSISSETNPLFSKCFQTFWPMTVTRLSSDQLLDCYGALLLALQSKWGTPTSSTSSEAIAVTISTSYRLGVSTAGNKRKLAHAFLSSHLATWMDVTASRSHNNLNSPSLRDVYVAGIDTIYHTDFMKNASEGKLDETFVKTLLDLASISPDLVATAVPQLMQSFVESSGRSRSNVSSLDSVHPQQPLDHSKQMRTAIMHIFGMFDDVLNRIHESPNVWTARSKILAILSRHSLATAVDTGFTIRLVDQATKAVDVLTSSGYVFKLGDPVLLCLVDLASADIDAVLPHLPRILAVLVTTTLRFDTKAEQLLSVIVEYHCKTRSIPTYLSLLATTLFSPSSSSSLSNAQSFYQMACSSPILAPFHCDLVNKAITAYVTPTQVPELATSVIDRLRTSWDALVAAGADTVSKPGKNDKGDKPRKKRKLDTTSSSSLNSASANLQATKFALTARLASLVLASLPLKNLQRDARDELQQTLADDTATLVHSVLKKAAKTCRDPSSEHIWSWSTASWATIRLDYDLQSAWRRWPQIIGRDRSKISDDLRKLFDMNVLSPGLFVLTYRSLVLAEGVDAVEISCTEKALGILSRHLTATSNWSGLLSDVASLDALEHADAVALLQVVLDRCLHVFLQTEAIALASQLAEIVFSLIEHTDEPPTGQRGLTANRVLSGALRRADFWELPILRGALLTAVEARTAALDEVDLESSFARWSSGKRVKMTFATKDFEKALAVLKFLLAAPAEFITRALAQKLSVRCLAMDLLLECRTVPHISDERRMHSQVVLRTFGLRLWSTFDNFDASSLSMSSLYLTEAASRGLPKHSQLHNITSTALRTSYSLLLRHAKEHVADLVKVVSQLSDHLDASLTNSSTFFGVLRWLEAASDVEDLQTQLGSSGTLALQDMCQRLEALSSALMSTLLQSPNTIVDPCSAVQARYLSLRFGRSLGHAHVPQAYGAQLLAQLLDARSHLARSLATSQDVVFALLVEEWRLSGSSESGFNHLLAAYIQMLTSTTRSLSSLVDRYVDLILSITSQAFQQALQLLGDFLAHQPSSNTATMAVLSVAEQTLHNSPEGTTKMAQDFITRCLQAFTNQLSIYAKPNTRLAALNLLLTHCSDRPASLRPIDITNLLSFMSQCTGHSTPHDTSTSRLTFQCLLSIMSTLIRLRRDLVANVLPHFAMLCSRLILCFRQQRPQLGARQVRQISESLPEWISPNDPLGAQEARAMGRLLGALATKTVVRTFNAPVAGTEAAASLARPFSKHAASVLQAYVDAVTDPLCTVSASVRKELHPGLFVLCGMMSEHSRDAMMVSSLDASGKIVLKTLWKEYEKQKYTGKG